MTDYVVKRHRLNLAGRYAAGVAALAVVLTVSGAYDTDDLSIAHRLTLFAVIGVLLVGQASWMIGRFVRIFGTGAGGMMLTGLSSLIATLALMTVELHALKFTPLLPKTPDPLFEFALFLLPLVGAAVGFLVFIRSPAAKIMLERAPLELDYEPVRKLGATTRIAGLLAPPRAMPLAGWPSGTVLRVVSRDHYLEIVTDCANAMIRGRMKDALAQLEGNEGIRSHRSWWVRADQVKAIIPRGRDYFLELADGAEAPVARGRWKKVKKLLAESDRED